MFEEKNVKHRANDASNDGHRPPLIESAEARSELAKEDEEQGVED